MIRLPLLAALALAAVPAFADTPLAPAGEVLTLSDADRAAMDAEAEKRALDAPLDRAGPDRRIHGTVEMMVGTGGRTGIAMSMVAPLGDDGYLALAYAAEQGGYGPRFGRRR
jgi:hypothetical protein